MENSKKKLAALLMIYLKTFWETGRRKSKEFYLQKKLPYQYLVGKTEK